MKLIEESAAEYAHARLLLTAVRALMESHPEPERFRESWAHMLAMMYRDHTKDMGSNAEIFQATTTAIREQQAVWETYAPYSEAARTKPPSPPAP